MKDVNVLMVGVGGYGVVLASDGMAEIGMNSGYDVKKTDSLGMAQRGGSVVSHMRWGNKVYSPMIKKGGVDYLLAFEQLEAARWAPYLGPEGTAIVADSVVVPVAAVTGDTPYPGWSAVKEILSQYSNDIYLVPADRIAAEVNNPRAVNMAMLGFLSAFLELPAEAWTDTMRSRLPEKFVKSSIDAFLKARTEAEAAIQAKEHKR